MKRLIECFGVLFFVFSHVLLLSGVWNMMAPDHLSWLTGWQAFFAVVVGVALTVLSDPL